MATAAMQYKERMLQLRHAVQDPETGEIYLGDPGEIHYTLYDRMNQERFARGLEIHDLPVTIRFDEWPGRGYIRRDTGEFMQADAACEWACQPCSSTPWNGESMSLMRKQRELRP